MSGRTLRLATRASPLALWQAHHVAVRLTAAGDVDVELVTVSTEGDRRRDVSLSELGGKGVFVKEVQAAVLDGRADLAVHSAKDLPAVTVEGLVAKLVHTPTVRLKDASGTLRGERLAAALRDLFDLS